MQEYPPAGSRPPISHPYPPSYRSHLVPSSSSSSSSLAAAAYTNPSPHPASSYAPMPLPPAQPDMYDPPHHHPHPPRPRSASDSSLHPLQLQMQKEGGAVPEGWTKEDEEAEREFLRRGMIDWGSMKSWRFWIRREWWYWYLGLVVISVLVILMTVFHDDIVKWLQPVANWMKDLPAGWAIPIAILFIISFPPLFGHEIVAILVGAVWGLWMGFGIVAAGTFLGEVGNFYAFRYCLRSSAIKYERNNLNYAVLAHVVREGGFLIVFMARLSAIPGHFTTAVFSTCGTGIVVFSIATILTLPKQLVIVYLGVAFTQEDTGSKEHIINAVVLVVGFAATIGSAWYIYKEMNKVRVVVWRKQRMERKQSGEPMLPPSTAKRDSYRAQLSVPPRDAEEEEARSPILLRPGGAGGGGGNGGGYQNPYSMSENTSSYEIDGPRQPDSLPIPERDMSTYPAGYYNASTESFPRPQPAPRPAWGGQDVQRARTGATVYSGDVEAQRWPEAVPAGYPQRVGEGRGGWQGER